MLMAEKQREPTVWMTRKARAVISWFDSSHATAQDAAPNHIDFVRVLPFISTRQGFFWWEYDITFYILKLMSWLGIVWDLQPVPVKVRDSQSRRIR